MRLDNGEKKNIIFIIIFWLCKDEWKNIQKETENDKPKSNYNVQKQRIHENTRKKIYPKK